MGWPWSSVECRQQRLPGRRQRTADALSFAKSDLAKEPSLGEAPQHWHSTGKCSQVEARPPVQSNVAITAYRVRPPGAGGQDWQDTQASDFTHVRMGRWLRQLLTDLAFCNHGTVILVELRRD